MNESSSRYTHRNGRTDKKGKNECCESLLSMARTSVTRAARTKYILLGSPNFHIGSIENSQKCETPIYSINDNFLSFRSKLIDDGTQEEEVNQRPGLE